jgi:hypothetical protein
MAIQSALSSGLLFRGVLLPLNGIFHRHRRGVDGGHHQLSVLPRGNDDAPLAAVSDVIFELTSTMSYNVSAAAAAADVVDSSSVNGAVVESAAIDYSELEALMPRTSLTSSSPEDDEFQILRNRAVAAIVVCLYAIVIVLGSVGSLLVILSIARSRLMWTATNVFIANLALSDLFVCAVDLPITLHYQVKTNAGPL